MLTSCSYIVTKNNHWGMFRPSSSRPPVCINFPKTILFLFFVFLTEKRIMPLFRHQSALFGACNTNTNKLNKLYCQLNIVMWWKWWVSLPNIDPCVPFIKPVKYSHFFGSLIYPFVQVEINNIDPHYVGYTKRHITCIQTHTLILRAVYIEPNSQETRQSVLYIENFPVLCFLLEHSLEIWN